MAERVRVTASMDVKVLKVFQRMSEISGLSLSRTLGDWCAQTVDGAGVVTTMYEQARHAPSRVLADMHARATEYQGRINSDTHDHEREASDSNAAEEYASGGSAKPAGPARLPLRAIRSSPRPVIRGETPPRTRGKR